MNGNHNGSSKNGRPTKLTPEVQASIVQAISAGNYLKHAAMYAGVCADSVNYWCKRGEREHAGIYFAFSEAVKKAEAAAVARNVAIIQQAAHKSWQAAAWWLERKFPDDFALHTHNELTGKGGGPVSVTVVVASPRAKKLVDEIMRGEGTE